MNKYNQSSDLAAREDDHAKKTVTSIINFHRRNSSVTIASDTVRGS